MCRKLVVIKLADTTIFYLISLAFVRTNDQSFWEQPLNNTLEYDAPDSYCRSEEWDEVKLTCASCETFNHMHGKVTFFFKPNTTFLLFLMPLKKKIKRYSKHHSYSSCSSYSALLVDSSCVFLCFHTVNDIPSGPTVEC